MLYSMRHAKDGSRSKGRLAVHRCKIEEENLAVGAVGDVVGSQSLVECKSISAGRTIHK